MSKPKTKPKAARAAVKAKRSSVAQELIAAGLATATGRAHRWEFPRAVLAEIEECRRVNAGGEHYISADRLARTLAAKYALPVGWRAIADRLRDTHGWRTGRWTT